jgi:GWxTD domain-containing protein
MNFNCDLRSRLPITGLILVFISIIPCTGFSKLPEYKITKADLEKLSPPVRKEFSGLLYFLNGHQVRQFLELANDSLRADWLEFYWKSQDPTPVTPYNEKRIEHTVRARLAEQFFKIDKWPGWDKRGEVFIRYGPPSYRGKIWGEVTVRKMHPPGELWYYKQHNMLVSFQNYGLQGEYIYSINPLGSAQDASPDLIEYLLYDTDQSITTKIPQNMLEFYSTWKRDEDLERSLQNREPLADPIPPIYDTENRPRTRLLPESIDDIMNVDFKSSLPKDVSMMFKRDEVEEIANNYEKVLEETPASYPFNFTNKPLPFYFSVDQFKGGNEINRVDVNIEVPVKSGEDDTLEQDQKFTASVVVWDERYNEVLREQREFTLRTEKNSGEWAKLIPTQIVFSLAEGYYRMGVAVESSTSGASTTYKTVISTESFSVEQAISDILFASRIANISKSSIWARGSLHVVPHPLRVYKKNFPIPIYFETYNLALDERGSTSYSVEYKVIPHSREKKKFWERFEKTLPIVSSRYDASGYGMDEPHHFRLGTDNLWKGTFDILITVHDKIKQATTYRKSTFSIID